MPHLRLVLDEPEIDPPAPFLIRDWRAKSERTTGTLDAVAEVEKAFARVEWGLERLASQLDDADPFPFPSHNDDGPPPRAA